MLTNETNQYRVITLNEGLVYQIFAEAIKPWEGKARYVGDREVRFGEDGLFAYAALSLRLGSSIKEVCSSIIDYVADAVTESLELPIEDIVLEVVQMTTSKTAVKRSIRISYRGSEDEEN